MRKPITRPTIYIAAPYSPRARWWPLSALQRFANVLRASRAAASCWRKGWGVICPHANSCFPALFAPDLDYQTWIAGDLALLAGCDALLYLSPSPGADAELEEARRLDLDVFTSEELVPEGEEYAAGRKVVA